MKVKEKILTGYTTLMTALCIIILVLAALWLNPTILSPPTEVVPIAAPTAVSAERIKEQVFKAIQLTSNPSEDLAPTWSPDGKRIAFESNRFGNWSIWIISSDGSNEVQLTSNETVDRWPSWSPDGKKIAFWSSQSGQSDIWIIDVDKRNLTRLTNDPMLEGPPQWSPDGKSILFSKKNLNWDIWITRIEGDKQVQLTNSSKNNIDPSWSPDGKKIVFASNRTGNYDVWIMNSDGSKQTQLTMDPVDEILPRISPNNENILYLVEEPSSLWSLWIMGIDGKGKHKLTSQLLSEDSNPSWSSDGKRIVFWRPEYVAPIQKLHGRPVKTCKVLIAQADGSGLVRVASNLIVNDEYPSWSPDGKRIAVTSNRVIVMISG